MDFSTINWLAVLLCLVASMIIGGVWFSPKGFYPMWWKAIGKTDKDTPGGTNMMMMWGGTVLASVIQAIFMGFMVDTMGHMTGATNWATGAMTGFWLWLGFVAPSSLTNKLFADRLQAWLLEAGNHLVTFIVMGIIQGLM